MKRPIIILSFAVALLLVLPVYAQGSPAFNISVKGIRAPTTCSQRGWAITYDRTTTITSITASTLTRYFVQYVNHDLNLVHYWGSGYSAYVQDYWVAAGIQPAARAVGTYPIPIWSDTYQAETIEFILQADTVIWALRATLTCDQGKVTAFAISSQPANNDRDTLPKAARNLVLALEDIPRYGNSFTKENYLGTIKACQTFYLSRIYQPRASISVWAVESLTGKAILLNGADAPRIVDVAEDYGQQGGQPILKECASAP